MAQVGRPRGLIDYATLEDSAREIAGAPATARWKLIWHPRTLVYFAIWAAIGLGLLFDTRASESPWISRSAIALRGLKPAS